MLLVCSASEQSDLSVCPHLLLSSATQKCLGALLHPKMPLLQLFPIKALQEGCSKTNYPLSAFDETKRKARGMFYSNHLSGSFTEAAWNGKEKKYTKWPFLASPLSVLLLCSGAHGWRVCFAGEGGWQMLTACFRGSAGWKVYSSFWLLWGQRERALFDIWVVPGQLGWWISFPFSCFSQRVGKTSGSRNPKPHLSNTAVM